MANADRLAELYRQAIVLGEEALQVLQGAPAEADLDRLDALLAQREGVALAAQEICAAGGRLSGEAAAVLRQVVAQQQRMEGQGARLLAVLRERAAGAQGAREGMRSLRQVLGAGAAPSLLNETR